MRGKNDQSISAKRAVPVRRWLRSRRPRRTELLSCLGAESQSRVTDNMTRLGLIEDISVDEGVKGVNHPRCEKA
jgi:hypothetical protein